VSALSITATDLEVELVAEGAVEDVAPGETTVPGRKLHDLVRALPEAVRVEVAAEGAIQQDIEKGGPPKRAYTLLLRG
jgi:DNA polymerase III sliding clamp (beta) subunit (PCNA family)